MFFRIFCNGSMMFRLASCWQWRLLDLILGFLKSLLNSGHIWKHYARRAFVNLGHRYMILWSNHLGICVSPGLYACRSPTMFHSWQPMSRAAGILWLFHKTNPPGCRKYGKRWVTGPFFFFIVLCLMHRLGLGYKVTQFLNGCPTINASFVWDPFEEVLLKLDRQSSDSVRTCVVT